MYKIEITQVVSKNYEEKMWKPLKEENDKTEYGWAPPVVVTKEERLTILEQNVEKLDLAGVIKAINGL